MSKRSTTFDSGLFKPPSHVIDLLKPKESGANPELNSYEVKNKGRQLHIFSSSRKWRDKTKGNLRYLKSRGINISELLNKAIDDMAGDLRAQDFTNVNDSIIRGRYGPINYHDSWIFEYTHQLITLEELHYWHKKAESHIWDLRHRPDVQHDLEYFQERVRDAKRKNFVTRK